MKSYIIVKTQQREGLEICKDPINFYKIEESVTGIGFNGVVIAARCTATS